MKTILILLFVLGASVAHATGGSGGGGTGGGHSDHSESPTPLNIFLRGNK